MGGAVFDDIVSARDMLAPIPDTVRFLAQFTPAQLHDLQHRHPEAAFVFRSAGVALGETDLDATLDATSAMLSTVSGVALEAVGETGKQLRSGSKLELVGGLLSVVATGSVVLTALGAKSPWTTAALGVIGLFASGIPLVVRWLRGGTSGASVASIFIQLRELAWDAQALHSEIERLPKEQELKLHEAVQRANKLAREVYIALTELGYSPNFRAV
jgi:hypothetical protein